MLPPKNLDQIILKDLTNRMLAKNKIDLWARPIDIILPDMDKSIDELIDCAYTRSHTTQIMLTALEDPATRNWLKSIWKEL